PGLEAQVVGDEVADVGVALGCVALDILLEGAALVEVGQGAFLAHVGEAYGLGLYLLEALLLEVGQAEVFEDEGGDLIDRHFGLVVVHARLLARRPGLALARPLRAARPAYHVADLGIAVARAGLLAAVIVITEAVLLQ